MTIEKLQLKHKKEAMEIFNYYVINSTAAFPADVLPDSFFNTILELMGDYPGYSLVENGKLIGFGFMKEYDQFLTFQNTVTVSYFISHNYVNRGLGTLLLLRLEEDAKMKGINNIIAEISTENVLSLKFHEKNGFRYCGTLEDVGEKFGRKFGVVYMQKILIPIQNSRALCQVAI